MNFRKISRRSVLSVSARREFWAAVCIIGFARDLHKPLAVLSILFVTDFNLTKHLPKNISATHILRPNIRNQRLSLCALTAASVYRNDFDACSWNLNVSGTAKSSEKPLNFHLKTFKSLPKQDIAINFKCIEGWSRVMNYVGARFSDFIEQISAFRYQQFAEICQSINS